MITSISTARCPLPVGSAAPAAHRTGGVQPAACPGRDWLPSGGGKGSVGSVAGLFVGGVLSGLGGAAQEVGDEPELSVGVVGEERIHRGILPGVQAVQVDVIEVEMVADVVIEQRELDAQLAQRLLDRGGQPSSVSRAGLLRLRYVAHMI